jgi:hypothetical protein
MTRIRENKSTTERNTASIISPTIRAIRVIRGSASALLAIDDELRGSFAQFKVIAHLLGLRRLLFQTCSEGLNVLCPGERRCDSVASGTRITNEAANV